jgi:heavy metal sensor kinase
MFFAKFNQARRTLRFRLMAWNAFVIVLTASVTLIGLRTGVRLAIVHEIDRVLTDDLTEIETRIMEAQPTADELRQFALTPEDMEQFPPDSKVRAFVNAMEYKDKSHKHHGWFVRIYDGQGGGVWSSEYAPETVTTLLATADFEPLTAADHRVVQEHVTVENAPPLTIQVGASTEFIATDMARIDRLVAIAVGVVLITGPAIGYWLAGRAIDPLAAIIHTTARLRPTKLDERLKEHRTGDELDQLARTINGFLNRIANYLEQRRDFLANAAHELRTPLAAIRSTAEVSLGAERSVDEYQELLVEIIEECSLLEALVNQLLLLAETESDRLRITGERVDFSGVAAKAIGMFQAVADNKEIAFSASLQPELTVEGNAYHLRQVVNNLIDNALKFTPAGGKVSVRLREEHNQIVFTVQDNGPGIPAEDLPHIFDRFFRGDRSHYRDADCKGTGLGLSICQAVVQAHSGTLAVETQPSRGTAFIATIPVAPETMHDNDETVNDGTAIPASRPTDSA